ncbi:hypothetical protein [Streptomyces blattellae]|uniref:hypothetical protein n=1 Tax=Streptomyces blattellae TaxID=2569855 RepID=UPI0012B81E89|nr:hypothetical protein [Streptomyces blattellae]
MRWENLTAESADNPGRPIQFWGGTLPAAPHADRAWKAMTRAFSPQQGAGDAPGPSKAGIAAYAVLLRGKGTDRERGPAVEPWLLLRDRTRSDDL